MIRIEALGMKTKMRVLCITHADFETPGVIADWVTTRGYEMTIARPYAGDSLSRFPVSDFLILMGGPQSPLKMDESLYLKDEILRIQLELNNNSIILGFCLGAQLIGEALGARTERSPEKEVGVYPIELTREATTDFLLLNCPPSFEVIHWHNDMPGLTPESVVLAKSVGCPRQIVRYQQLVYGFQCHLEITRDGIEKLAKACPGDLEVSKFTQNLPDLLEKDYTSINNRMIKLLNRLVEARRNYKPV